MSKSLSNTFLLVLAIVGCIVTTILTIEHYSPAAASVICGPGPGGCTGVLNSNYGHVGPIPTAVLGLGMYLTFLALCLKRGGLLKKLQTDEAARAAAYATAEAGAADSDDEPGLDDNPSRSPLVSASKPLAESGLHRQLVRFDLLIWLMATSAVCISWWLQYTALFVIVSFCPWCFTSALLVTMIFLLASRDYLIDGRPLNGEQKLLLGVTSFIGVLFLFLAWPSIQMQWILIKTNRDPGIQNIKIDKGVIASKDMHIIGDQDASVLLVEFADYMCPACGDSSASLNAYMKQFPKRLRLAFRNFPLPIPEHKWSRQAAEAAEAAAKQGKFWEMHDYLFKNQKLMKDKDFTPDGFITFARDLELNIEKFKKDLKSDSVGLRVQADMEAAQKSGINSTPTFVFITAKSVLPVAGKEKLKEIMENPENPIWKEGPPTDIK